MAGSVQTKLCRLCCTPFTKREKDSSTQWKSRLFCSKSCSNKANGAGKMKSPFEKFWVNVTQADEEVCWVWAGTKDNYGYGLISNTRKKSKIKAHRLSYELHNGQIPSGLIVRHKCDNPSCVNPNHLEVGTQKDNMMDASLRKRLNPISILNLKPGKKGFYGAGPTSNKELVNVIS